MQKSLFFKNSFSPYLIPILLFSFAFVFYSSSLENQPYHPDEIVYLSWGGPYFEIIKEGDFNNPCLKGLADCELLHDPDWAGHNVNYSPIRNFFWSWKKISRIPTRKPLTRPFVELSFSITCC